MPLGQDVRTCLAVLAAYNRKRLTLRCIESAYRAAETAGISLLVTLFDDNSSDGTVNAVAATFPDVRIVHGDGERYWVGGMRAALSVSEDVIDSVDYLLFLNDDTVLYEDALVSLATVDPSDRAFVVGTVVDPVGGDRTYGGYRLPKSRWRWGLLPADQVPAAPVDTFNCNATLVTVPAYRMLGGFDGRFTHCMADIDMGLRALRLGIPMRLGTRVVGECKLNTENGRWSDRRVAMVDRLRDIIGPKELPPMEWLEFTSRHCGPLWPAYFVSPYLRAFGLRRGRTDSAAHFSAAGTPEPFH